VGSKQWGDTRLPTRLIRTMSNLTLNERQLRTEIAELQSRLESAESALRSRQGGVIEGSAVEAASASRPIVPPRTDAAPHGYCDALLAQVADAVIAIDADQRVTYLNAAAERHYGVVAAAVLGRPLTEMYESRGLDSTAIAARATALRERGAWRGDKIHVTHDGRELDVESSVTSLRDAAGRSSGTLAVVRDITERKQLEREQAYSDECYRALLNQVSVGFCIVEVILDSRGAPADLRYLEVNRAFESQTGLSDAQGRLVSELIPGIEPEWIEHYGNVATTGEPVHFVREARALGRWYDVAACRFGGADRRRVAVLFSDITARVLAEQNLRAEVAERKQAEARVRKLNGELEQRVAERVVDLATKARLLVEQNAQVELSRRTLESKAAELALTSKYKSEFLANMSHELRTPLNSILIFSQQLAGNAAGNLTGKQVEFSRHINSSGTDLLHLIDDILDLSKIESGTVTVLVEEIPFAGLRDGIDRNFRHVAEAKNLPFEVTFSDNLPRCMDSDAKRLQQILKNLVSNAIKFTTQGHVDVRVGLATHGWTPDHPVLGRAPQVLAFSVEDTGIGVAPEKQRLIFEAFQQADAGTSRKYGGTGLGLAISRELAVLLGGEIKLHSVVGQGSTFTLFLPMHYSGPEVVSTAPLPGLGGKTARVVTLQPAAREEPIEDDREHILPGDTVLLIVEDDPQYARILLGLAREKAFKGIVASKGAQGLSLARQFRPAAISLDVFLPDMVGWTVLNQLKFDPLTRHIPVQIVTVEEELQHGLAHGAFAYVVKSPSTERLNASFDRIRDFISPRRKRLLVVEADGQERRSIVDLLGYEDIEVVSVASGGAALAALLAKPFECMVLDPRLPDMSGFELLERMQVDAALAAVPVAVFTGAQLSAAEQERLKAMARHMVLKDVQSAERLLDVTALFLHRVVAELPPEQRKMLDHLHRSNEILRGRKVLVVDDDARNIFALTSLLEDQEVDVFSATNGRNAIEIIHSTVGLDMILMDIMMPDMDGFETMREIRTSAEFRTLPILALTAKAMLGDREKCLDAGASDYIAKPVNADQLLALMRAWLFR
jgi:PAS domain S-box-containing protein